MHVQLLITVVEEQSGQRRRMLLETSNEGNAFQSYIGTASVQQQESDSTMDAVGTDGTAPFAVGLMPAMLVLVACIMG